MSELTAPTKPKNRVEAFDGIRCLALLVVLLDHCQKSPGFPHLGPFASQLRGGVTVFLILSGFLITKSLLSAEAKQGRIKILPFYERQAIRFIPPVWVYLAFLYFGAALFARPEGVQAILSAGLFISASGPNNDLTGHLWSQAMQVQFWLGWPIILTLCPARHRLKAAASLSLLAILWPPFHNYFVQFRNANNMSTQFQIAPLFIGALIALFDGSLPHRDLRNWVLKHAGRCCLAAVFLLVVVRLSGLVLLAHFPHHPQKVVPFGEALTGALYWAVRYASLWGALGVIIFCLYHRTLPHADRLLTLPPLRWLGSISFSVYIWHMIFCWYGPAGWVGWFPFNLLVSIAVGALAYFAIELPTLRWRGRVKKATTPAPPAVPPT